MCRRVAVLLSQGQLVDHHGDNPELGLFDQPQKGVIECSRLAWILETSEAPATVDDVVTVQNGRIVRMVRQMLPLEIPQPFMKRHVLRVAEPAAQQTQKPVTRLVQMFEHMVPRFVQVEPVTVRKGVRPLTDLSGPVIHALPPANSGNRTRPVIRL